MTLYRRAVGVFALAATLATFPQIATAQRGDSYTWKLGVQGGSMIFQTQTEDTEIIPSGGAHFMIMARKSGLMVGIDEGFGSDQRSGLILFNNIRRYQAVMMAYPVSLPLEPYFGVGGGLMQVVSPRVDPAVTDPFEREEIRQLAQDASTNAFATFLGGVQGRWGRVTVFGQYQLHTAPGDDALLSGVVHTIHGGIRIALGSSREGIRSGGYYGASSTNRSGQSAARLIPIRGVTMIVLRVLASAHVPSVLSTASGAFRNPSCADVMPIAAVSLPGPSAKRRSITPIRRRRITSMPSSGSIARIRTAAPTPAGADVRLRHQWRP
jgi:hypothetical protein